MRRFATLTSILCTSLALPTLRQSMAELLYFVKGGQVQAPAVVKDGVVRIETSAGDFEFPTNDFRRIVPGFSAEREWPSRRATALEGPARAMRDAARWALENGLTTEACSMIRSAFEAEPNDSTNARMVALLDRIDAPTRDPDLSLLRQNIDVPLDAASGRHFTMLHERAAQSVVRARLELMDHVFITYYVVMAWQGIELPVPSERLVSVYFDDRAEYQRFLRTQSAGAFHSTLGYYHPTLRATVAFDVRTSGTLEGERESLARSHADRWDPADPRNREHRRRRLLFELESRALDHGTAAHETIHQLVVASGFAPRTGQFPLWLHEGFAAQFEVVRGGRWAGVGRVHDLRLADWKAAKGERDLVVLVRDTGFGRGYRRDLYAQCWALVFFLRETRPRSFAAYLDLLRAPEPSATPSDPDRALALFRKEFGDDLTALQQEWIRFVDGLRTPLGENMLDSDSTSSAPSSLPGRN